MEIKTTPDTPDSGNLQRAADFVHAYILGFEVQDAIALLRLDDLYIECFEVKDVKTLRGEHMARCIGRLAGAQARARVKRGRAALWRRCPATSGAAALPANWSACASPTHSPHLPTPRAGKNGKTKFTVENATRTRIVLADTRIHILGSFQNIRAARDSICALILGSPAGKVYNRLHSVTTRLSQSY